MLASTCWPPGSGLGNGDLCDLVETISSMARQDTGQAGGHTRTDDDGDARGPGCCVEPEEVTNIFQGVAERHHTGPASHRFGSNHTVSARGRGQNQHAGLAQHLLGSSMSDHSDAGSNAKGDRSLDCFGVDVMDMHDTAGRFEQRTEHMGARGPDPDDGHIVLLTIVTEEDVVGHRKSVPVTSRQPSVCGGTPPVPRIRNRAATIPVIDSAATTRRTNMNMSATVARKRKQTSPEGPACSCTNSSLERSKTVPVGLTRIELVTSPLSGVRSNRLSYSPGPGKTSALVRPRLLVSGFAALLVDWHPHRLLLDDRDTDATNEVRDEVEHHCEQHHEH